MDEKAYMDAERFPLSAQKGLTFEKQKLIDAVNYDDLREMQEEGRPMSDRQKKVWAELTEKMRMRGCRLSSRQPVSRLAAARDQHQCAASLHTYRESSTHFPAFRPCFAVSYPAAL